MQCPICLGTPEVPITLNCCKNIYCQSCIQKWNKVRTVCPLCCSSTSKGEQQVNKLKTVEGNQNFDDGFLMLETEMKEITTRVGHLNQKIVHRKEESKKIKSSLSVSLVSYLIEQMEKIKLFQSLMHEQFLLHNRATTVQYMQLIAYEILTTQKNMENNYVEIDEDFDYQYEDELYMDEFAQEYEEYDYYEQSINKKAQYKSKKKAGGGIIDTKNKPVNIK